MSIALRALPAGLVCASLGALLSPASSHSLPATPQQTRAAASLPICADSLRDQSSPMSCLEASSVPEIGKLVPMSASLFVHPTTGRVGVNTTYPFRALDVVGDLAVYTGAEPRALVRRSGTGTFGIVETVSGTIAETTNLISVVGVDSRSGAIATLRQGSFLTALTTPASDSSSGFVLVRNHNVDIAGINGATGEVFGSSKSFVQPHPVDATKEIQYVSLEGPEHGVYCRGSAHLTDGRATVSLPEDFRLVAREQGLTVSLTPLGPGGGLWVEQKSLRGIEVRGENDVAFDYLVMGVRAAMPEHEPVRPNVHFAPAPGSELAEGSLPGTYRELMIRNGTLGPDGRVDEARAMELGHRMQDGRWTGGPATAAPVRRD
jgi:hypothetical protein